VKFYNTFAAQGQNAANLPPVSQCDIASPGMATAKEPIAARKMANACAQKPKPLPDGGQQTVIKQQTVMREAYAETGDSGFGLLQRFVSHKACIYNILARHSVKHGACNYGRLRRSSTQTTI
jgi:hypothetical protein